MSRCEIAQMYFLFLLLQVLQVLQVLKLALGHGTFVAHLSMPNRTTSKPTIHTRLQKLPQATAGNQRRKQRGITARPPEPPVTGIYHIGNAVDRTGGGGAFLVSFFPRGQTRGGDQMFPCHISEGQKTPNFGLSPRFQPTK